MLLQNLAGGGVKVKTDAYRTLVILTGLLGAAATTLVSAQGSGLIVRGVVEGDTVEGVISRVDHRSRTITLDNGREYVVPAALSLDWEFVRPGAPVKIRYSVDGGRNIATAIDLRP